MFIFSFLSYSLLMLRSKGKLVAPRVFNRPDPVEILKRAEASSKVKLGREN